MPSIESRNELFRGQQVEKPKPAIVVGRDKDGFPLYACPHCGNVASEDACDHIGAEPGCVFCNQCSGEFEM